MQNEVAAADLYFDPDDLNELSDSELFEQISTGGSAIKKVRINKSIPLISCLDIPSIQERLDIPLKQLEERAYKIRNNTKLQARVSELLTNNQIKYPPPKFVEQSVYSGFPSNEDELWMERFHSTPWEERHKLIEGFVDSRYKELAERLICSSKVNNISDNSLKRYKAFLEQRLSDKGPWLNLSTAKQKIQKLMENEEDKEKVEILKTLEIKLAEMSL